MPNLEHIKPGDMLAFPVKSPGYGMRIGPRKTLKLVKVERLTATQIACSNGKNVRRKDGAVIGDTWVSAMEVTQEVKAKIEAEDIAIESHQKYVTMCHRINALCDVATSIGKHQDTDLIASLESAVATLEAALEKANAVKAS